MKQETRELTGRILVSTAATATAASAFLFDWNGTHLFNPAWPRHAHFHDAQTMFLGLGVALITLLLVWSRPVRLGTAWFASSLYWFAFLCAAVSPQTSLDDPGYRIPHPLGVPANLCFGLAMLLLAAVGSLIAQSARRKHAGQPA